MIRLARPAEAPEVLTSKGAAKRQEHEQALKVDPKAKLEFDRSIYADETVKEALVSMQHEKCAFCESKPLHVSDGDVEHFRPKAAVRQDDGAPLEKPGYYWLAYDWSNLLFSCERCNRRHKKNLFPLVDPTKRARSPASVVGDEAPLFVDPSAEDPELHIGFREHVPIAIGDSERGRQTIGALGLRRAELNADREERLQVLRTLCNAVASLPESDPCRSDAEALIAKWTGPSAEYSLMCRLALASWTR